MLKIIKGFDKRKPTSELRLDCSSGLSAMVEGSGFATGKQDIIYGGLQPRTITGRKRVMTSRDNAEFTIKVRAGDGVARINQLIRDLQLYALDAQRYEEDGIGEPVYLGYRMNDDLNDVPEPVIGQWSTFMRVIDLQVQSWPNNTMNPTSRIKAWDIEIKVTIAPYAEGVEQIAGIATGAVKVDEQWGVIVAEGRTDYNKFTNPSLANSTYSSGWSGTSISFRNETREGLTRSYNSAVMLTANGSSGRFTQSIATSTNEWFVSFYAKRIDGQPVTSADCQVYANNGARTSYYIDNKDGWYRIFAVHPGNGGAREFGIEVEANKSVIVDDFQLEEWGNPTTQLQDSQTFPRPFFVGDMPGASWDGTRHASHTSTVAGSLKYDLSSHYETNSFFSISAWVTATSINPLSNTAEGTIFYIDVTGGTDVRLYYSLVSTTQTEFTLNYSLSDTHNYNFAQNEPIHLVLTLDGSAITVYINGVESNAKITTPGIVSGTSPTLYLGSGTGTQSGWAFDGFKVWDYGLSAAQVSQLYENERCVKEAGDIIGMPIFSWTHDGDNNVENEANTGANDYNTMILGGVPGDLESDAKIEITGHTFQEQPEFWVGRKALSYKTLFQNKTLLWNDSPTSTGNGEKFTFSSVDDVLPGKYSVIVIMSSGGSGGAITRTFELYSWRADDTPSSAELHAMDGAQKWDSKSISLITNEVEYVDFLSDINIAYPRGVRAIESFLLEVYPTSAIGGGWSIDEVVLIPHPNIYIKYPYDVTNTAEFPNYSDLVIDYRDAYARDGSGQGNDIYSVETIGDGVTLEPNKYNHLYFVAYDRRVHLNGSGSGNVYEPANNWTVTVYVTPRYNLPGMA